MKMPDPGVALAVGVWVSGQHIGRYIVGQIPDARRSRGVGGDFGEDEIDGRQVA